MRLERHVGMPPEMETKGADSAEDGHDRAHHDPDRDRHVLRWSCESFAPMQIEQASAWPVGEASKSASRTNNFAFIVINRSRFIFR